MFKMREGVPYEASIFFGGDGIRVEEVAEGETAEVNGYALAGPAVIVREWPLRGIAICPYGADMNTESASNFAAGKSFAVTVIKKETKEIPMTETILSAEAVEVAAPVETPVEQPVAVETQPAAVEAEGAPAETVPVVEAAPVEAEASAEAPKEEPPVPVAQAVEEPKVDDRRKAIDEFCVMEKEFGAEIATATFKAGGSYKDAETAFYRNLKDENDALKAALAQAQKQLADKGGTPAAFAPTENQQKKSCLFKTGK
jgi:hypothetical protein